MLDVATTRAWVGVTPAALSGAPHGVSEAWALWLTLAAYIYFAGVSIALTIIDVRSHRLPNAVVLPSYLVAAVLLTAAAALTGAWGDLLRAGVCMVLMFGFYLLLHRIRSGGMGGGDVKLAGVIGIYLGWIGWGAVIVGVFAAFLAGGIFGILLVTLRRARRDTPIPFGPWMLLGAWIGVLGGELLARWYLGGS